MPLRILVRLLVTLPGGFDDRIDRILAVASRLEGAGRQFDPSVVQAFSAIEQRFEAVAAQIRNQIEDEDLK